MKSRKRSLNQVEANNFDLNIFNLLRKAQKHADGVSGATMKERERWKVTIEWLQHARIQVHSMMHEEDRYETSR